MRGTHVTEKDKTLHEGIIPAHAGNTHLAHGYRWQQWDHPRACGEHRRTRCTSVLVRGSSPRMRGTPFKLLHDLFQVGIIPAHAGNTLRIRLHSRRTRDHPRACGEHRGYLTAVSVCAGSSPRMRGTHGFVPIADKETVDHPRACGEHLRSVTVIFRTRGSSPRMRGTLFYVEVLLRLAVDHPRACGEHQLTKSIIVPPLGSSPRMRGTPVLRFHPPRSSGIIPAHAGNTAASTDIDRWSLNHPRACGEH